MPAGAESEESFDSFLFQVPVRDCGRRIAYLSNVAVTDLAWSIVRRQVPFPEQAPDQLVKWEWPAGVALRLTRALEPNAPKQTRPHAMPAGALVTFPEPVPRFVTVSFRGNLQLT
jgi:hypothetical protein